MKHLHITLFIVSLLSVCNVSKAQQLDTEDITLTEIDALNQGSFMFAPVPVMDSLILGLVWNYNPGISNSMVFATYNSNMEIKSNLTVADFQIDSNQYIYYITRLKDRVLIFHAKLPQKKSVASTLFVSSYKAEDLSPIQTYVPVIENEYYRKTQFRFAMTSDGANIGVIFNNFLVKKHPDISQIKVVNSDLQLIRNYQYELDTEKGTHKLHKITIDEENAYFFIRTYGAKSKSKRVYDSNRFRVVKITKEGIQTQYQVRYKNARMKEASLVSMPDGSLACQGIVYSFEHEKYYSFHKSLDDMVEYPLDKPVKETEYLELSKEELHYPLDYSTPTFSTAFSHAEPYGISYSFWGLFYYQSFFAVRAESSPNGDLVAVQRRYESVGQANPTDACDVILMNYIDGELQWATTIKTDSEFSNYMILTIDGKIHVFATQSGSSLNEISEKFSFEDDSKQLCQIIVDEDTGELDYIPLLDLKNAEDGRISQIVFPNQKSLVQITLENKRKLYRISSN